MRKFIPAVAVSLLLAACGSSSSTQANDGAASAAVKTAPVPSLGASVLVDSQGLTLYHLSGEQNGKWICASAGCVKVWHPLAASTAGTPAGSVGSLGTVKRPDGTMQVAYKGQPLYTFAGDKQPGEAKGQGIKDVGVWTAVTASSKPATTTTAPSSSSGTGRYGY